MSELLHLQMQLEQALVMPVDAFLDPSRRIYWPFMLLAMMFALLVLTLRERQFAWQRWSSDFFSSRYFLSLSSLQDIGFWFLNSIIKVIAIVPLLGGHLAFMLIVVRFLHGNFGTQDLPVPPPIMMMTLYTLTFLLVEDLSRYSLHRLMHQVPFLWRFHRTHHSATVLTPLTLFRIHPVEMSLYYVRGTLVFGCVSGVFIYLWGGNVSGWQILGVDAIGFLFNMAAANLRHSHIWLSFGWVEKWFISPAQHQLHHSNNPRHFNQNYGSILAVWDRIFKSWLPAGKKQLLTFGLR